MGMAVASCAWRISSRPCRIRVKTGPDSRPLSHNSANLTCPQHIAEGHHARFGAFAGFHVQSRHTAIGLVEVGNLQLDDFALAQAGRQQQRDNRHITPPPEPRYIRSEHQGSALRPVSSEYACYLTLS